MKNSIFQNSTARAEGIKDARSGLPLRNNDRTPFIRQLIEKGKGLINRFTEQWLKKDKSLKKYWLSAMHNEYSVRQRLGEAEENYEEAAEEYRDLNPEEQSVPRNLKVKSVIFAILLGIFALTDVYFIFKAVSIFGDSDAFNLLISLIIGALFIAGAHFIGKWAASFGNRGMKYIVILFLIILIAVVATLGYLRGMFFDSTFSSGFAALFFTLLNFFVLFGAMIYSYNMNKPGIGNLKQAESDLNRLRRAIKRAVARRLKTVTNREKTHNFFRIKAQNTIVRINELLHVYWGSNLRARKDQIQGTFNPDVIGIEIPEELDVLEWNSVDFSGKNDINKNNQNYDRKNRNEKDHSNSNNVYSSDGVNH